jgi:uncharacterized protein YgiM (DUF1202 family)
VKVFLILALSLFFFVSCVAREQDGILRPEEKPRVKETTSAGQRAEEPEEAPRPVKPERRPPREERRRVISESLNIRSGPNINYEILGALSEGDLVSVKGSQFGWLEIELPRDYKGWVHSDYVELASEFSPGRRIQGRVKATRLNVRALPGTRYSIMSQLKDGERVYVVDKDGEWLGIEISGSATGWVHSQHVE